MNNTALKDRILWFDGDSTFPSDRIAYIITNDIPAFVDTITKDIEQYNRLVDEKKQIKVKKTLRPLTYDWTIPKEYLELDVEEYLADKLYDETANLDAKQVLSRVVRVAKELDLYEKYKLMDILRVLIYVINTLNRNNIVWGVGRGSSVSSYILYLIGVHDVDSVKYELDIEDFLHNGE